MTLHPELPTRLGTLRLDLAARAVLENLQGHPFQTSPDLWEVSSSQGGRLYTVNLVDETCTCMAGQQSPPTPCKHVALAMLLALTGARPRAVVDHTHPCGTCGYDVGCSRAECRTAGPQACPFCRPAAVAP